MFYLMGLPQGIDLCPPCFLRACLWRIKIHELTSSFPSFSRKKRHLQNKSFGWGSGGAKRHSTRIRSSTTWAKPVNSLRCISLHTNSSKPSLLCRARWHRDDHFIFRFSNLISYKDAPRKKPKGFYKTFQTPFFYIKSRGQVFCSHSGNTPPHLFIDSLSGWLIKSLSHIDKPESINDPVVP